MKTLLSALVMIAVFFISCKKDNGGDDPDNGSLNVYLGGSDMSGDGRRPCYWKNDTRVDLPNAHGGDVYGISVDGSNVYTSGRTWEDPGQTIYLPCYWLNGSRKEMEIFHERSVGIARSILAFDGTVYSAGVCSDSLTFFANNGWRNIPCYWKNGKIIRLEMLDGFGNASASSLTLVAAPNRVITYISGTSYAPSGYDEPCYWKIDPMEATTPDADIEPAALDDMGYGGAATGVGGVTGNIIFVGYVDNEDGVNNPCFWQNGARTDLSKVSENGHGAATGVAIGDGALYISGYTDNNFQDRVPCVWKNGTRTDLPLPAGAESADATGCKLVDGNLYVSGTVYAPSGEFPCYWKNGELVPYTSPGRAVGISLNNQ